MRIAYMLTSLGIGGAERQVVALAERMTARGHDVALVVLRPRQLHEVSADLEVVRLGMMASPLSICRGLIRGYNFMRQFKPDLVHSHTFPANMAARMLRLVGSAPKVITTIHNVYEGGWMRTLAYRLTDPLAIHTTAVSAAVADRYIQIGAVSRHKRSVITNGIDVEVFAPARREAEDVARREPGEFVWIAAGRDVPAKDFDNLLAAFTLVRTQEPRARLCIAGEHGTRRGINLDESHCVRWLGLRQDMPAAIGSGDAFVLSSAWEGMPLVVGEAMAMEKAVVATDVGGVRELVGDAGVMVPAESPAALAEGMLHIMRMPEAERREMARAARARIVQYFDMGARAREWEVLYSKIPGSSAQGAASHAW